MTGSALRDWTQRTATGLLVGVWLLASCSGGDGTEAPVPTRHGPRLVRDDDGGALVLHGANVESYAKSSPDRLPSITRDEVRSFSERWGMNFVRYLILWDGLEPEPGVVNQAYLDGIEERLDWFAAEGVWVMLDMHQDVYAHEFCCDGAPPWAVRADGLPHVLQPIWSFNYFQPAPTRAFDNFWLYTEGAHADLQDHYVAIWRAVAERFRDHPAVLGYDVMNEPYPGSLFDHAEAFTRRSPPDGGHSAHFDRSYFAPFYERAIAAIREADPDGWVFVEPRFGAPGNGSPSYLPRLADPRAGEARVAYAPHLYSVLFEALTSYWPTNSTLADWERERTRDAAELDAPVVIGEWGFGQTWDGADRMLRETLAMADRMQAGWAYWAFDPGGPTSWAFYDRSTGLDNPNADLLVRAYPQRIAGDPISWAWDPDARVFELAYAPRRGVRGATQIYVPARRFYPTGYDLEVSAPAGTWSTTWDDRRELLSLATTAGAGSEVRVAVRPKAGR